MILPGSSLLSLILLIFSLLCLGSWANSLKMAGPKWRFELYYYDFALGALLAALLIAFTFGSLGLDGFTVRDDLSLAGKRQDAFAVLSGAIFNLGNFMMVAAISLAGMSVAIPVSLGVALIAGALLGHALKPEGSAIMLAAGCSAVLAGVIFCVVAFRKLTALKLQASAAAAAALAAEPTADQKGPVKKKSARRRPVTARVLLLGVVGGILLGVFQPLLGNALEGENGLGPYSAALLFSVGVVVSTVVYNLFFMNLPVQGAALEMGQYFSAPAGAHLYGIAGGAVWFCGLIAAMVANRAEGAAHVAPALAFGIGQGAMLIGAAWGLGLWKDFSDADSGIRLWLGAMFALLLVGIGVVSVAPLYGAH